MELGCCCCFCFAAMDWLSRPESIIICVVVFVNKPPVWVKFDVDGPAPARLLVKLNSLSF